MREIFCCGTGQRTAYCATCGKRLQAYPLSDLLNHCREQAHKAVTKLKAATASHGPHFLFKHRDDPAYRPMFQALDIAPASVQRATRSLSTNQQRECDKLVALAHQWTSWATALERVMKHAATLPPEPDQPAPAAHDDGGRNLEV